MSDERNSKPSASSMERYALCPGSWAAEQGIPDQTSEDATTGNRIHAWLAGETVEPPLTADELKAAGVGWVNHNLNTSERFHSEICTTHTYGDRVGTIQAVKRAGLAVCSGGIIGMGETANDRVGMLLTLANLAKHPESVPINHLVQVAGTPLAGRVSTDTLWSSETSIITSAPTRPP